jgi:ribosomal protein L15
LPTGKRGFTSKNRKKLCAINLEEIYANLDEWVVKGSAVKNQAGYQLDLKKAGYDKLLGTGSCEAKEKLFISTDFASKSAVEKVKAAGGEVKILKVVVKKEKKRAVKPKKAAEAEPDEADESEIVA